MSLQGSLDTFALPDVLALLASTKKTGELRVGGRHGSGQVWLADGQVVAASGGASGDLVDALFELLRHVEGDFTFDAGRPAPDAGSPRPVEPLLAEATARLAEWRVIEAVVPSLATAVALVPDAPGASVVLEARQWSVLVAVAEGGTVATVAERLGEGEFGACRLVKELVDAGLVTATIATAPEAVPDVTELVEIPARARRRSDVNRPAEPAEPAEPQAEASPAAGDEAGAPARAHALARELAQLSPAARQAAEAAVAAATPEEREAALAEALANEDGEPINRSLLLKFLSSVRS